MVTEKKKYINMIEKQLYKDLYLPEGSVEFLPGTTVDNNGILVACFKLETADYIYLIEAWTPDEVVIWHLRGCWYNACASRNFIACYDEDKPKYFYRIYRLAQGLKKLEDSPFTFSCSLPTFIARLGLAYTNPKILKSKLIELIFDADQIRHNFQVATGVTYYVLPENKQRVFQTVVSRSSQYPCHIIPIDRILFQTYELNEGHSPGKYYHLLPTVKFEEEAQQIPQYSTSDKWIRIAENRTIYHDNLHRPLSATLQNLFYGHTNSDEEEPSTGAMVATRHIMHTTENLGPVRLTEPRAVPQPPNNTNWRSVIEGLDF